MSDDSERPLWTWIAAVLIGLPVLYVASFGPACWLEDRALVPIGFVDSSYKPLVFVLARYCPDSMCIAMTNYGMWGSKGESGAACTILIEKVRLLMGADDKSRLFEHF